MPFYQKRTAFRVLLFTFVTFYSFLTLAQPAKIVPISVWGANPYEDVVELGEHYYFKQANSAEIEVYGSLGKTESARLGSIAFENEVRGIFKFNGLLVVVDSNSLSLYQVDGLLSPERVYGIAIGQGSYSTGNSFAVNDNKLAYLNDDNSVFVIQVDDNQYSIFHVYSLDLPGLQQDTYIYRASIGFSENDVHAAFVAQQNENDVWVSRFMVAKLSLQDDFAVSLEFEIAPLVYDLRNVQYLKNGAFIVDIYAADNMLIYGYSDEENEFGVVNSLPKQNPNLNNHFTNTDNDLWVLNSNLTLQRYNVSDLTNVIPLEQRALDYFPNNFAFFNALVRGENNLIAVSKSAMFNIDLENEAYSNDNEVFYLGGYANRVTINNKKLYIPFETRIDVVDVSTVEAPILIEQMKSNNSRSVGDLYSLEDDLLSLNSREFSLYDIDRDGIPSYLKSINAGEYLYDSVVANDSLFVRNDEELFRFNIYSTNSLYELPYESDALAGITGELYNKVVTDDYLVFASHHSETGHLLHLLGDAFDQITYLSSLEVEDYIEDIVAFDDYIYLAGNRQIKIYKIENDALIAQPFFPFGKNATRLDIVNEFLMVSGQFGGATEISLYSLEDPLVPQLLSRTKLQKNQYLWGHSEVVFNEPNLFITDYSANGKTLILQLNKTPVMSKTNYALEEDLSLSIELSELDPEKDKIQVEILIAPEFGELAFNQDQQMLFYEPATNYFGEQSAKIKLQDVHGNFSEAELHFSISAVNDAPSFNISSIVALEGQTTEVDALASDIENDSLTLLIVEGPSEGEATITEDGVLVFKSITDFSGETSITLSVTDGFSEPVEQTIIITIQDVNDAPSVEESEITLNEDQPVTVPLTIYDVEGHNTELEIVSFSDSLFSVEITSSNKLNIVPKTNFNGEASINVKVTDELDLSAEFLITVKVLAVNDLPTFAYSRVTIDEDTVLQLGDIVTDVDGDKLIVTMTQAPINGDITISTEGAITYTPFANFNGGDTVGLSVTDGVSAAISQNLTIEVTPINDPPHISNLSFEMTEDQNADITLDILEAENDVVTLSVVNYSDGIESADISGINKLTIVPAANFYGQATITVNVKDELGESQNFTLSINLVAVNDVPDAVDVKVDTAEGASISGSLPTVDADGEMLSYAVDVNVTNGSLTLENTGAFTYVPNLSFSGSDEFSYTVNDTSGNSVVGKVTIFVKAKPVTNPTKNSGGGGATHIMLFGLFLILLWRVKFLRSCRQV